ncbi:M28 family peptidase [Photobacterium satsumensis]|uniref:M28 family peptidase n=1 Tax=Photobacterium satsumensis TaxID=2910239 RepID=UPI003D0E6F3C
MKPYTLIATAILLALPVSAPYAQDDDTSVKTAMAESPSALINAVVKPAFLPPDSYNEVMETSLAPFVYDAHLPQIKQVLDEKTDPRNLIDADEIQGYSKVLQSIAEQSKADGEILWGRIQGTKYERQALRWIESQLTGMSDQLEVHYDPFESQFPQWRPTVNELTITAGPGLEDGDSWEVPDAITAFLSGMTPAEGISADMIYVGQGTASELQGRDLTGKVVLLRGSTYPSALMNSSRVAFSRLASGDFGMPAGVIVWWDTPGVKQVAGRVGAPGGGDAIGKAMPWISISNDNGMYLRKMLDRATAENPVKANMKVRGVIESGKDRMSGNVWAKLPGKSGKYIILPTHVDGYFYGIHDNGASVAMNMALANYYANKPKEEREHGIIFMFQGDHEVPGVGGTVPFVRDNKEFLEENLLMVIRPEHLGLNAFMDERPLFTQSNVTYPLMLNISNRSPLLLDIFKDAIANYSIPTGAMVLPQPSADEMGFYPPYNKLDGRQPIYAGWIQTGTFYHSTADIDLQAVNFDAMERIGRAHAYIIDELGDYNLDDLHKSSQPLDENANFYGSDFMKMTLGNW